MNRSILRLAIPNIISNITVPLVGMADIAILGRLESDVYIGAVAVGGMIFSFIYSVFSFLRMGTAGFTAQAFGEGRSIECMLMLGRSMFLGLLGACTVLLLRSPIDQVSFLIVDASDEVEALARNYFYIRIYAAPAALGIMVMNGWFIGLQNARIPMYIAILVNVMNVLLNYYFVFIAGMTSDGVAWGTLIAQYTGLVVGTIIIVKRYKSQLKNIINNDFFNLTVLRRFFRVNADIMIRTLSLMFTFAFFTARSAAIDDTLLAVNTILLQFLLLFSYVTDGFAHAAEALVGKYKGRNDLAGLKTAVRYLFLWGLALSLPFTLAYAIAGNRILYLLTTNSAIIEASNPYIFWTVMIPVITFAAFIWDGIYIGATASAAMRNTMLISTFLVYLPAYYIAQPVLGNQGLWLALMLFMISRAALLTLFSGKHIFKENENN